MHAVCMEPALSVEMCEIGGDARECMGMADAAPTNRRHSRGNYCVLAPCCSIAKMIM